MGNWTMVVEGRGIHHNGHDNDAESILARFVEELSSRGHMVAHCSMTSSERMFAVRADPSDPSSKVEWRNDH